MAEQSQTNSIQARIAALNLGQVGRAPITAYASKDDIPPEYTQTRPQIEQRSQSISVPQTAVSNTLSSNGIGNEPNGPRRNGVLPPPTNVIRTGQKVSQPVKPAPAPPPRLAVRKMSTQPSPALPPRRPSENLQLSRKASNESISSTFSNISSMSALSNGTAKSVHSRTPSMDGSRIKVPVFDPSTLPPLPPKRTKEDVEKRYQDIEKSKAFPAYKDVERARMPLVGTKSTSSVATVEIKPPPTTPSLPPRRPTRPVSGTATTQVLPERPPPMPARSALSYGMNKPQVQAPTNESNERAPSPTPPTSGAPPPVPLTSRPDIAQLHSTKPKPHPQTPTSASSCLLCRDFSAPDAHAAKFPRESVPSLDWIATQLTTPFSSLTDQARAIFTWLHHNISYDVEAFFSNRVQPSTPASTLMSGLAVCEGYAGLFTAIATTAGLESVVVGGHGKGFGFSALHPGAALPAEYSTHAWNAVKIDNGDWKLIDCCWGAGNVNGKGQPYNKQFSPRFFTMTNDEFGLRHFPTNKSQFFRSDDGRLSWEEYIIGDTGGALLQVYSGVAEKEGVSETGFLPKYIKLSVRPSAHPGPTVRFQFSRICEHWDPVRNGAGKPYVFVLAIHGIDGRGDDFVPFETNGIFWWADVVPQKLGAPGQKVSAYTVETLNGQSGRGLSVEEYRMKKGRVGMSFGGLAMWELV
ncbi:MAG: hypothetical protein Q9161_000561 [Pseudevernia consocians]